MNNRLNPDALLDEMPNACIDSGKAEGSCARRSCSKALIIFSRPASLAPPLSARNSRRRENHITIVLARMPNTICATILAMKNPGP